MGQCVAAEEQTVGQPISNSQIAVSLPPEPVEATPEEHVVVAFDANNNNPGGSATSSDSNADGSIDDIQFSSDSDDDYFYNPCACVSQTASKRTQARIAARLAKVEKFQRILHKEKLQSLGLIKPKKDRTPVEQVPEAQPLPGLTTENASGSSHETTPHFEPKSSEDSGSTPMTEPSSESGTIRRRKQKNTTVASSQPANPLHVEEAGNDDSVV